MILPIRLWPDPVLGQRAAPVAAFDAGLRRLAADMLETMYAAPGRGLAGPQVGVLQRLFVMDTTWKDGERRPRVVVNPSLVDPSDETAVQQEGCLSLPGFTAGVERPVAVTLRWQDADGTAHEERLTGFDALCVQHEADHLDGVLTIDRIGPAALADLAGPLAALRART